jgi:hypothetical protein
MVPGPLASYYVANKETGTGQSQVARTRLLRHSREGGAMCDASKIRCCGIPFVAVFLAFLCLLPATAQKSKEPGLPKYDLHTETKMKVTVDEVKLPPKSSEKDGAHLLVKSGTDSVDVYLCPKSFFDDMGMSFSKGDEVTLTGSKVKQGEADLILAREVVKGNDTFVLRDEKGNPVWN